MMDPFTDFRKVCNLSLVFFFVIISMIDVNLLWFDMTQIYQMAGNISQPTYMLCTRHLAFSKTWDEYIIAYIL